PIDVNIDLGGDNFAGFAGALTLIGVQHSKALATPSALRYSAASTTEVITTSGSLPQHLQFKTSQVLADVSTNTPYKFTVSLYTTADAGTKDGSGFYQPTGTAFTTVVVENPDA